MSEKLVELVNELKKRPAFPVYGSHFAADYLRTIDPVFRGGQVLTDFGPIGSVQQWEKALQEAESKLVWLDESAETVTLEKAKAGDSKYLSEPTPLAIMDAVTVLSSKLKDRDREVMDPDGATVDLKMPWLWQHLAVSPVGKLVRLVEQTKSLLKVHYALADTLLARDTATMTEFGALRTSHGFVPSEWEQLPPEKDGMGNGCHYRKYYVYEGSSVSIPSNTDAEVTAHSRNKLCSPIMKAWAAANWEKRPASVSLFGTDVQEIFTKGIANLTTTALKQVPAELAAKDEYRDCVSAKIRKLIAEGKPQDQAIAIAISMCKSCGCHEKGVVPFKATAKADAALAWDGAAAVGRLRKWAGVDGDKPSDAAWTKYSQGFAFVEGDGGLMGAYKLPHHDIDGGELVVVYKGVAAAMAAVNGARTPMKLSEADRKAVYSHLAHHYKQFDVEPPALKEASDLTVKAFGVPWTKMSFSGRDLEGSWEDITSDLQSQLKPHLLETSVVAYRPGDSCWIVAMFDDEALVMHSCYQALINGDGSYQQTMYRIGWKMDGTDPMWDGEPVEVEVQTSIVDAKKEAAMLLLKAAVKDASPDDLTRTLLGKMLNGAVPSWPLAGALADTLEQEKQTARRSAEKAVLDSLLSELG